jgi:hypothetical protein
MISKVLTGILMLLSISVPSLKAQPEHRNMENKSPDESAQMVTKSMSARLDLSESQKIETQRIYTDFFTKQNEIGKKYRKLGQAKKEMKALKESEQNQVKSILTIEQLDQLKEGRKGSRSSDHSYKSKTPEEKVERMKEKSDLSTKQEGDLLLVFQTTEKNKEEIKGKYPELKEAKNEMKALKNDLFAQLKEVLTESQFKQLKTMKKRK